MKKILFTCVILLTLVSCRAKDSTIRTTSSWFDFPQIFDVFRYNPTDIYVSYFQ